MKHERTVTFGPASHQALQVLSAQAGCSEGDVVRTGLHMLAASHKIGELCTSLNQEVGGIEFAPLDQKTDGHADEKKPPKRKGTKK